MSRGLRLEDVQLGTDYELDRWARPQGFSLRDSGLTDAELRVTALAIEPVAASVRSYSSIRRGETRFLRMVKVRRPDGAEGHVQPRELRRPWAEAETEIGLKVRAEALATRLQDLGLADVRAHVQERPQRWEAYLAVYLPFEAAEALIERLAERVEA